SETLIPTTEPERTLRECLSFFKQEEAVLGKLDALGIACFGPLDLRKDSASYGQILATPKEGWAYTDLVSYFSEGLNVSVGFDTDVNAAVLAEAQWGAGMGLTDLVYFTIGTGIGGGAIVNGSVLHGLIHPEMGHVRLPRLSEDAAFAGICPFHGDCFEGLASGPAMLARSAQAAETLDRTHPAWEIEAAYIALAMVGVICNFSPQRIILGGGVMNQQFLFPLIREKTLEYLNNYILAPEIIEDIENYIVPPALGKRSGILGAKALGEQALLKAGM
ncbi:MAG: ROK family protein, partial [Anaerolineaceae bacterium]|nr:ROK family protein [Anaerolineaceae bacterium]